MANEAQAGGAPSGAPLLTYRVSVHHGRAYQWQIVQAANIVDAMAAVVSDLEFGNLRDATKIHVVEIDEYRNEVKLSRDQRGNETPNPEETT